MKRFLWLPLFMIVLGACSRSEPTPTILPTLEASPTLIVVSTPTPAVSPVPRVTVVPSATRLQSTAQIESVDITQTPTVAFEATPTPVPSATPTERVVETRPTHTPTGPTLTPTVPESPLPSATTMDSPLPPPPPEDPTSDTPTPTTENVSTSTPTATRDSPGAATPSPEQTSLDEGWRFENVFTYLDEDYYAFYIQGEVFNDTGSNARIMTFWPIIVDSDGEPANSKENVDAIGNDYKQLRESIVLAPGQSLAFSFLIDLATDAVVEDDYDFVIAAEPAEASRLDLDYTVDDSDESEWPPTLVVLGTYSNPGPDLSTFVAVVVTLYDSDGNVLGLGWSYKTDSHSLSAGEHDFKVAVEMWEDLEHLELDVHDHWVQVFGY